MLDTGRLPQAATPADAATLSRHVPTETMLAGSSKPCTNVTQPPHQTSVTPGPEPCNGGAVPQAPKGGQVLGEENKLTPQQPARSFPWRPNRMQRCASEAQNVATVQCKARIQRAAARRDYARYWAVRQACARDSACCSSGHDDAGFALSPAMDPLHCSKGK